MDPPAGRPQLLREIEHEFSTGKDEEATQRVQLLAFDKLLEWEAESGVLRAGLERINWWETLFERTLPITHERLKKSTGRRANAAALLKTAANKQGVWRALLILQRDSERKEAGIWQAPEGGSAQTAVNVADEFGIDRLHFVIHRGRNEIPLIRALHLQGGEDGRRDGGGYSFELPSEALWNPSAAVEEHALRPVQAWTVPFQEAVVVLLESNANRHELVWIRTNREERLNRDLSMWAINHNTQLENPDEFRAPPFLQGDATLTGAALVAGCEGRVDIPGVETACAALSIRRSETLIFDQVKQEQEKQLAPKNWRQVLTQELWERSGGVITASCYVLDAFLLYACDDGVLRAHPRGNPQSTYHVRDMRARVYQMASLYNVLALIHSAHVLEVWHITRRTDDPFLQFHVPLYSATNADPDYAPLMYGPYVLFRDLLDGVWVRVQYEGAGAGVGQAKQLIKVPLHAGWSIVAIKNANWRYWTLVLRNPQTKALEDFFLVAPVASGDGSAPTFMMAPLCTQ